MKTQAEYVRDGAHLPAFLRDFHDQKDVFKSAWEWFTAGGKEEPPYPGLSWVSGHVFVIDCFLKFMAAHGWTLQRSRADAEFADIEKTIEARKEQEAALFKEELAKRRAASEVKP